MTRICLFSLLITLTALAGANDGPFASPCPNCPEYTQPPYPHTGLWYNPQRSGTGINIDVQNGIMAAVYYGYREDGSAVWYLFSGELILSEAQDVYWELEADLYESSNGEPINGEYRRPDNEVVGTIHVEVMQRHLLRFSIDGGPYQRMAPLVFGSHYFQPFEPESNIRVPDFRESDPLPGGEGGSAQAPWLIVQMNPDGALRKDYGFASQRLHWGQSVVRSGGPRGNYGINFWNWDFPPSLHQTGELRCGRADDIRGQNVPPAIQGEDHMCLVWVVMGNPPDGERIYYMPVGNVGDRRFSGVSEDGWVLEGYRLRFD